MEDAQKDPVKGCYHTLRLFKDAFGGANAGAIAALPLLGASDYQSMVRFLAFPETITAALEKAAPEMERVRIKLDSRFSPVDQIRRAILYQLNNQNLFRIAQDIVELQSKLKE